MINTLLVVNWSVDSKAFSILGWDIAWYGIFWASGVALTAFVISKMFESEKRPEGWFDSFFVTIVVALIVGARLGHCLFYDPVYYLSNPLELLNFRGGGLASHGGAIGMLIGVCIFSLRKTKKKVNWKLLAIAALIGIVAGRIGHAAFNAHEPFSIIDFNNSLMLGSVIMGLSIGICVALVFNSSPMAIEMLDRLIVGVCLGATSIRLGNLMNSEIYGAHTDLPWGFNFLRDPEWHAAGALPSHPTQLYEALVYFSLFLLTMFLFWKTKAKEKIGLILGIALFGIFFSRILIETIKNNQVDFEEGMLLNMGQILSIPFVLWAIYLMWNALVNKPEKETIKKKK